MNGHAKNLLNKFEYVSLTSSNESWYFGASECLSSWYFGASSR